MKRWLQITLVADPVLVDAIADYAVGMIDAGVEIEENDDITRKKINIYIEKEDLSLAEMDTIVLQLEGHIFELAEIFHVQVPQLSRQTFGEEDWGKNWKKYFSPFAVAPGLIIAPTWEHYQAQGHEKVLIMDPGMAFGTGHHATTALVVELLMEVIRDYDAKQCVLDVGTGTGVLGMAAALLGAEQVYGIDNDPVAVAVAAENIVKNDLGSRMDVADIPLKEVRGPYSLVLANIVHDVLVTMAADLYRVTSPEGHLILSGILQGEQVDSIRSLYERHGFSFLRQLGRGEWAALLFRKDNRDH
ncbi:MAG: 50S ribosomal protein L11 methyltransferase [Desulfopila sp.]|jgi:ribosomal protein L11 methyltransferase|nr:50S ribosomal protein L11 methyltransferase [Desulfopila sp.]